MAPDPHTADPAAHAEALGELFRSAARAIATAPGDPAACARVREASAWAESALRAYGLESNAAWFRAVRERGADAPQHAPYAWTALAGPRLEALATALDEAGTLEPLVSAEAGAQAHALAIAACEEPVDETQWLFFDRAGERIAVEWESVLEYGLAPGADHNLIMIADGSERATVVADWLHGKGTGRRLGTDAVEDGDGHAYRILRPGDAASDVAPDVASVAAPEAASDVSFVAALQPAPETADIPDEEVPVVIRTAIEPPPGPPVSRALVADDSIVARVFLGRLLRQRGIEVDEAEDAAAVRALWSEREYDRVFLDADMPGGGAFTLADAARPEVVVLVKDELERRHAHALGFDVVLLKPFAEDEVARAIEARATRAGPGG
jgi:CheY-like chemotaxis protein